MTDLSQHIQTTRLMDTHEHLFKERDYLKQKPDVLCELFGHYLHDDLVSAGATTEALKKLLDPNDPDLAARFRGIRDAWEKSRHTGYGETAQIIIEKFLGLSELTPDNVDIAQQRVTRYHQPGERLHLLREIGNLDHIQVDDFCWACLPDESGVDFFFYDLSWAEFSQGNVQAQAIEKEVGIRVTDLRSLREGLTAIFAKYGPCAIAVKSQHAYQRTLRWEERNEADVERALQKQLKGEKLTDGERLCLGDWCWARGVELAIEHNLPFKMHTGYYVSNGPMPVDYIRAGNLCTLLAKYPKARFVLMHISYPYSDELVALAKHFPNVYVDMCWAWSIDPFTCCDFLRRMIHAVPSNKLFGFGGDTFLPINAVAYAIQARKWLTRALQAEVDDGFLTEPQAIALATRFMSTNQQECFDLAGKRAFTASRTKAMAEAISR